MDPFSSTFLSSSDTTATDPFSSTFVSSNDRGSTPAGPSTPPSRPPEIPSGQNRIDPDSGQPSGLGAAPPVGTIQSEESLLAEVGINPELSGRDARKLPQRPSRKRVSGGEGLARRGEQSDADDEEVKSRAVGGRRRGVLYWIRQDFRLHDNPAMCCAAELAKKHGGRVYCVFIHSSGMNHCIWYRGTADHCSMLLFAVVPRYPTICPPRPKKCTHLLQEYVVLEYSSVLP